MPEDKATTDVTHLAGVNFPAGDITRCPPPLELAAPEPGNLSYSFTLPSAAATPSVAHEVAEVVLDIHGLADVIDPALLLVLELTAYACRFTMPGEDIYLSLRYCDDTLRLTVFDTHPRHTQPRLLASCDELRRASLKLTPKLVHAHHGTWGWGAAEQSGIGTRTWATLVNAAHRWTT